MLKPSEKQRLEALLSMAGTLPHKQLKRLITFAREELKTRYPRNHRGKLYGNLRRDFSDEEFARFIKFSENPKAHTCFRLMRSLGLRIGEAVLIKIDDINFLAREILIHTEKAGGASDILPLHDEAFELLQEWVNTHSVAIMNHDGYIFFSDNPVQQRQHISKDWLRNYFGKCRDEAGLAQSYGKSRERSGRKPRRLFRLTSHSNRHSFGTKVWRLTRDPKMVQLALRQRDSKSADTYIHVGEEYVREVLMDGFRQSQSIENILKIEKHPEPQ